MKQMKADRINIRRLAAVMLAVMLLSLMSCGDTVADTETSGDDAAAETAVTEEETKMSIKLSFAYPTDKIQKTGTVTDIPAAKTAYMARGEKECVQFVLSSDTDIDNAEISIESDLKYELLRVIYVSCGDEQLPDPLAPAKTNIKLIAGQNVAILVRFTADSSTAAGDHAVKLTVSGGTEPISADITVHVWDFSLPEASYCRTAFGLNKSFIGNTHGVSGDELDEMYAKYYEYLLDNHICAYNLPYDILDSRADKYLDDPRVNTFVIPYGSDDEIKAYYDKLSSKPEWFAKGVFYPLDEPTNTDMISNLIKIGKRLAGLYPGYRMVTPFFTNISYKNDDQVAAMTGITNVWCPKLFCYDSDYMEWATFPKRMAERQAEGDEVWWYVCWEPGKPYVNLYVDEEGLDHRLMFWQQRAADVTGFLYWGANHWSSTPDPWASMMTVPDLSRTVFGDGSVLYNGNKAGVDGPCGSLRVIDIADGVEDFDMLTLGIEKLGREAVDEIIAKVSKRPRKYTSDPAVLYEARIELGNAIEAAGK